MGTPRTTICCSALALITSAIAGAAEPLALFPIRVAWSMPLKASLAAPPAFDGKQVYIPIEGDRLVAYDLNSGAELWTIAAHAQFKPASGESLVFLAEPDALVGVREGDGSESWRTPLGEVLVAPLVWDNGWLIAATANGALSAFRGADGQLMWQRDIGSTVSGPPTFAADRLYVPVRDGRVLALRVDTGEPLWERRLGGVPNEVFAVDDRLYVGSTDNFFYCLTARNGQIDWRWRTGGDIVGTPVADAHRVYFVSFDNVLRGLDLRSGAQRWKRPLPLRPVTGPLRTGTLVIVSGTAPPLRAFQTRDGAPGGEVKVEGELAAPAYLLGDRLLPLLVVITRDIAKGTAVTAFTRAIDPPVLPMAPLPNVVRVEAPKAPRAIDPPVLPMAPLPDVVPVQAPQTPQAEP